MTKKSRKVLKDVSFTGIADKGLAIGRTPENEVVFATGVVPGDVADIFVTKKRSKFSKGRLEHLTAPSPHRRPAFCRHFEDCGGCKWQNLDYTEQVRHKEAEVVNALQKIGKIDLTGKLEPILPSEKTRHHRNKLEFTFSDLSYIPTRHLNDPAYSKESPALGFHVAGAWNKILDVSECYLQGEPSNAVRNFVKAYALEHGLSFYSLAGHTGLLRGLIIRTTTLGQTMVIIQFGENDAEAIHALLGALRDAFPELTSIQYIINQKANDSYFDLDVHAFYGPDFIVEAFDNIEYRIGPKSFFQTNPEQAKRLFDVVREYGDFSGEENVYDLYTGLGSIALYVAGSVRRIVGIETVEEAIVDARINAVHNGIENAEFYAGDVKDILTDAFARKHGQPDVVITDPPRAGMHADVVDTLLKLEAQKIVYVSCNPSTQARDLDLLSAKYEVVRVRPVDMFPHTHHVENVALLRLKM